jgi:hypothetical protein
MLAKRLPQQRLVAGQSLLKGVWGPLWPASGAFDVSEEEGDGAGGKG